MQEGRHMARLGGTTIGTGLRVALVATRWNHFVVDRLVEGATDALQRAGVASADIALVHVPGAFEIPLAAKALAQSGRFDAVVTLGAVIRGATAHFDFVAGECARGVADAALQTGVPILFGVLTTDTIEQAIERAGTKAGNKGAECAIAAIEMAQVLRQIRALTP